MDLYNHPATPFVAGFIGSPRMNLLTGDAATRMGCTTYGIRPEHLLLSTDSGTWHGTIRHIERLGADAIIYLETPDAGQLVARTVGDTALALGQQLWATPAAEREFRYG